MTTSQRGTLYVVGTPIGNLEDLTCRARRILGEVDRVAAEDTRTTGALLGRLGIRVRQTSLFEGNEHARVGPLVEALVAGESIALVSECGTPGISDPGGALVGACVEAGIPVVPIPGPTAVTTLVSVWGGGDGRFRFEGFLPRRGEERRRRIAWLRRDPLPAVIYEAPTRLAATLEELAEALGPRRALVGRELTKLHEELIRGTLPELALRLQGVKVRGEVTLLVAGAQGEEEAPPEEELAGSIRRAIARGERSRDIAAQVAEATGWSKREAYAMVMRLRGGPGPDEP
ncbi:MAG: 16S rRNA (cytidine(1402)-2'-O)-methyltransferase [Polyangia bacterium]|jgi:16S rRNA (cytidine1402-2'-O)-methyltransferase|nr:16S rRNA (cytidine(1402)-2'-O)-methyltransferase [Polyangia bacterium]